MNRLNCKDYIILKIRFYASDYYLKKFNNNEPIGIKKHWESAQNYTNFFWKFIEKLTGKESIYFYEKYRFNTKECVLEEIHETYGIIIHGGEVYYTYFIPKNNTELFDWIINNLKNPYKILKKTYNWFDSTPQKYQREYNLEN